MLRFRPVVNDVATASPVVPSAFSVGDPASACWGLTAAQAGRTSADDRQAAGARCTSVRQPADAGAQNTALADLRCGPGYTDIFLGHDNARLPLVACDRQGQAKYLLGPTFLDGSLITDVTADPDPNGAGYVINLTFDPAGARIWATYTAANIGKQVAFVLDTQVVSAPTIQGAITGGRTEITGNFTQQQATDLVHSLAGS